jgi:peptidoglycan/LPS O-acetylase OafA/YrhL
MRIPALDGLRALAAFIVALSHFSNQTGLFGAMFGKRAGQFGVMVFFLISGFLMGRLYMTGRFDRANVGDYVRKRIARVFPLYLGVVVLSALAFHRFGLESPLYEVTRENVVAHLLFREGVSVLWTIPVEVQFYALFIGIWWVFSRLGPRWTAILLVATALLAYGPLTERFPFRTLPHHLHYFLLGVYVSIAARGELVARRRWDPVFGIALVAMVLAMPKVSFAVFGASLGRLWMSPVPIAILTTLLWSSLHSALAIRTLGGRTGRFFGDISYSVYLLHIPVLRVLRTFETLNENTAWLFAAFVPLLIAASYLSFRLLEAPARRTLNSIPLPLRGPATSSA